MSNNTDNNNNNNNNNIFFSNTISINTIKKRPLLLNLSYVHHQYLLIRECKKKILSLTEECQIKLMRIFFTQPYPSAYNAHNQVILQKNNQKSNNTKPKNLIMTPQLKSEIDNKINSVITDTCDDKELLRLIENKNNNKTDLLIFNSLYFGCVEGFFNDIKGEYKPFKNQTLTNRTESVARDKAYRLAIQIANKLVMSLKKRLKFDVIEKNLIPHIKNLKIVTNTMSELLNETINKISLLIDDEHSDFEELFKQIHIRLINSPKQGFFGRIKRFFTKKPLNQPRLTGGKSRRTHKKRKHN
jgi:hypothetical protein